MRSANQSASGFASPKINFSKTVELFHSFILTFCIFSQSIPSACRPPGAMNALSEDEVCARGGRRNLIERRARVWREALGAPRLPTLIRFLVVVGALAGLVYGGLYYLATFVKIPPHEITETVELPKAPK